MKRKADIYIRGKQSYALGCRAAFFVRLLFSCMDSIIMRVVYVEDNIPMTKTVESEVENMCNLSQGVIELGRREGQLNEKISLIIKKVKKGKPIDVIAEELEEDIDIVTPIYEAVVSQAPDYDMEKIIKNISTT